MHFGRKISKNDRHKTFFRWTYQSLFLQQRCVSIKHEDRPDAEEEQLTEAVEEGEEVGVLDTVAVAVPHTLHCLVQPYADVWGCPVKVNAITISEYSHQYI